MFFKPVLSLRSKSHLFTRLEIRDERSHAHFLNTYIALVYVLFGFVDCVVCPGTSPWVFFLVRVGGILLSRLMFLSLRGRAKYGLRLFCTTTPYLLGVEFIMLSNHLLLTPYFAGLALVMVTATMLFPVRFRLALVIYGIGILPIPLWLINHPLPHLVDSVNAILMAYGSVLVCAINSNQTYSDYCAKLVVSEKLARDLGRRQMEINEKAEQLIKRQIFESQFSPQVVTAILKDRSVFKAMRKSEIVAIVIDIENSTKKAHSLDPDQYKQVIEEVLDVFSAACLKWNITLDKFLGDGVQAFAGAPLSHGNDYERAIKACDEAMQMLMARSDQLNHLWREPLNVRFAVCKGEALVGFIGRGIFKSYTAIGELVSFTHRLAAVPAPWTIASYVWESSAKPHPELTGFSSEPRTITGLKGFGEKIFEISVFKREEEKSVLDIGRCAKCETPLVVEDGPAGFPRVYCPACSSSLNPLVA